MRSKFMVLAVVAAFGAAASAQTTGVPGCNDYDINGFGSGTTSCTSYTNPPASPITFNVSCGPNATQVYFAFSLCPCFPAWFSFPPSCCGTAVNTVDLDFGCSAGPNLIIGPITPGVNSAGLLGASFFVPNCPVGLSFSTQALVIDPSCISTIFLFTQAYNVNC